MQRRVTLACLLLGSSFVACSSDDSNAAGEPAAIPGCVLQVIQDKCQRCHGDPLQHGAPAPFFTVDDFQARYFNSDSKWWQIAAQQVEDNAMPFVALNALPEPIMPPVEPLTADEKATLLGWLKAGALPARDGECE